MAVEFLEGALNQEKKGESFRVRRGGRACLETGFFLAWGTQTEGSARLHAASDNGGRK